MLYYKAPNAPDAPALSLPRVRLLTAVALTSYPLGSLLRLLGGGSAALDIVGLALIVLAFFCAVPVVGSSVQRIVAGEEKDLDEFELGVRQQALSRAYMVMSAIVALSLVYGGIANDIGWWLPRDDAHWNALFWGFFLWATMLPAALLSWNLAPEDGGE